MEPTEEEAKWIRAFKRLAKKCPDSLWLFSGSGTLYVMRKNESGHHAIDGPASSRGGVDQDYILDHVDIENDGGDW